MKSTVLFLLGEFFILVNMKIHLCGLLFVMCATLTQAATFSAQQLVHDARSQMGVTVSYDPSYQRLNYPMGDVNMRTGVCTDVVIRAYRKQAIDLQVLVYEDMHSHFAQYPKIWGLKNPDKNIDHRRVPNLQTFFIRHGQSFKISHKVQNFHAGDLVTWIVPPNRPHIGIVSDRKNAQGYPLIIHNIGAGVREEDILFSFPITGHYRYGF